MTDLTETKREVKAHNLEKHLRKGFPISARLAEKNFGISGTGFHRTLNRFKSKGMIINSEWVEHAGDRFKLYRIDESQRVSSHYVDMKGELAGIDKAFASLKG